jgi:ferredoxin/flavodoxin---NADP+ reductase
MNKVVLKRTLSPGITLFEIEAPLIAKNWQAGQFVIVRPARDSERIPLTVVGTDPSLGIITMVVQSIGKTTAVMEAIEAGKCVSDIVGPLGLPAIVEKVGSVYCVAGGVGVAELLPVARAFRRAGNYVAAICGARNRDLRILTDELYSACTEVYWSTDDGSSGFHGNVVQLLKSLLDSGPDLVHVIGPIPMMKAAAELTRPLGIKTLASLNPIMIDGTGMCGGCRVSVSGQVRFACVDGPEFDAHQVDFDELARRNMSYTSEERAALDRHKCKIGLR